VRAPINATAPGWCEAALQSVEHEGYAILENVLEDAFLAATRDAMYEASRRITASVGEERLKRAGEVGVLRILMLHNPLFFRFLEIPQILDLVDRTVAPTAIMHLQNGFILPSEPSSGHPSTFQNSFHQDFPRVLNGYRVSINLFFAIDAFTEENGATLVVPGTHQRQKAPSLEYLKRNAVPLVCPSGSVVCFDSTLWHAAGTNRSGKDRLAINHQFTHSYIKQQIDYPRALGAKLIEPLAPRTQQLLGWFTRPPASYDDFYRDEKDRLYRRGQG
jgi:ectoine hydroxylase-related dioxygenase (phytanoyl-CoA dioxygenase family)